MEQQSRSLVKNFVKRDLKLRYTQSFLGPVWVILQPFLLSLVTMVIFSLVFKSWATEVPYYLFVLIGYLNWGFFSQTIRESSRILINNRSLVVNANLPLELLLLSGQLSRLVDLIAGFGVFGVWLLINQFEFHWLMLVYLLVVACQLIFQLGIALVVAAVNVYYRDVQYVVEVVLNIWFYLTPVIYPLKIVPEKIRAYLSFNPLTQIMILSRQIIFDRVIDVFLLVKLAVVSFVILVIGILLFKKFRIKFADVI